MSVYKTECVVLVFMNLTSFTWLLVDFCLFAVLRFQPRASCTLGKHCIAELHLHPTAKPAAPGCHAGEQCWRAGLVCSCLEYPDEWREIQIAYCVLFVSFLGGEMGMLFILFFQRLTRKSWWAICKLNLLILQQNHRLWLWNHGRALKDFVFDLLIHAHRWKWPWLGGR